jgi:hypothetical protein
MNAAPRLQEGLVDIFISRRVCARCYGELAKERDPEDRNFYTVHCPTCNGDWNYTTVSRAYAVKLGQKAMMEYYEAKANLPDLFPPVRTGKTPEELAKELGF